VFLDPRGAREVVVEGTELAEAIAQVEALVALERDAPAPLPPPVFAEP
jgi:hypothetical protein